MDNSFDYIGGVCESPERDLITRDAIKGNLFIYRVARMSDNKPIRDSIWNLDEQVIYVGHEMGTIEELRQKGHSWEDIFPAAIEACSWVEPRDYLYN